MDYLSIGTYFVTLAALTAVPGPLMAVLVARSLGRDAKGASAFAMGLCAGDMVAVSAVALGIGVWVKNYPELLSLAKYMGVAYLLWQSVKVWNDRSFLTSERPPREGWMTAAFAGAAICLGNPSTLLIYMLLLPRIAPTGITGYEHIVLVASVTFAAVGMVFFGTILMARQLNRIINSCGMLNRMAAATIALTSVWILAT